MPIRICRSGEPLLGGLSPVLPGPGTNGDVLTGGGAVVMVLVVVVADDASVLGVVGGVVEGVVGGVVDGVVGGVVLGGGGVVVAVPHDVSLMVRFDLSSEPLNITVATAVAGTSLPGIVTLNCSGPLVLPRMKPGVVVCGAPFWYVTTRAPLENVVWPPGVKIQWNVSAWPDSQVLTVSRPFLPSQATLPDVSARATEPWCPSATCNITRFHAMRGNDPRIGLRLSHLLRAAGLEVASFTGSYSIIDAPPGMRPPAWAAREAMLAERPRRSKTSSAGTQRSRAQTPPPPGP